MKNTTERKVTVTLPAELADRLERAREKAREPTACFTLRTAPSRL